MKNIIFRRRFVRVFIVLIIGVLLFGFAKPVWNNLIKYPIFEKEVKAFQQQKQEVESLTELNTFRGVMHVHSFWSHDCVGKVSEIIPAAKMNGIDFVFLSDHPHGDLDTIPRGYNGFYDGVLIVPGSEKKGFNTWPLDSATIDWSNNKDTISKIVVENGGLIFYAHTEEPHNWANPYYQGMEIYNFHTDTKDENYLPHILNFTVNGKTYRNWAFRELFDEQVPILAKWDSLNKQRKIVGFSAVDTHENMNFRARQINKNQVEWLGPNADIIDTVNYNSFNRLFFHEPDANGWVFKYMIDTYETAFSYITNYVLADSLTTNSLGAHILNGHMYTAFKSLADAKGFFYYSVNSDSEIAGIMGDSVGVNTIVELKAVSPFPGKFRLLRNGEIIDQTDSGQYYYSYNTDAKKGAYRIEVWLKPGKKYLPWLYTNPIYIY